MPAEATVLITGEFGHFRPGTDPGRGYSPVNTGGRLSRKAVIPSA